MTSSLTRSHCFHSYVMGGRVFESLEEVVARYKSEQIVEGFRLQKPVFKHVFEESVWTEERAQQLTVYQTIRESRESQRKNRTDVLLSGFLHKKSARGDNH